MPLLSFWRSNRDEVLKMTVEQVVSSAGDGHLRDGSEASKEFRGYLRVCPSESLFEYARYCLEGHGKARAVELGFGLHPVASTSARSA